MKIFRHQTGFTLAETLIVLMILATITIFTIPKLINSQQNGQKKAMAKDVIGAITAAHQKHKFSGQLSSATTAQNFFQYFNYVKTYTGLIDTINGFTSFDCSVDPCVVLHQGGVLAAAVSGCPNYGGTTPEVNDIVFMYDPDGNYSGSTSGGGKALQLHLYYNGRITSRAYPSATGVCAVVTNPTYDPVWFSW